MKDLQKDAEAWTELIRWARENSGTVEVTYSEPEDTYEVRVTELCVGQKVYMKRCPDLSWAVAQLERCYPQKERSK